MKHMKKLFLVLVCALGMASVIADTNPSLFNANELQLGIGTSYVVDYNVTAVKDAFATPYDFNLQAGVAYYITRNIGVEAWVPFYQTKGVSVSEVQAGLVLRVPLARETPLFKNIAPYVGVGGVYSWEASEWAYIGKVGAEFRFNKKWGVFAEGQYRNQDFEWNQGATTLAGGIHLVF